MSQCGTTLAGETIVPLRAPTVLALTALSARAPAAFRACASSLPQPRRDSRGCLRPRTIALLLTSALGYHTCGEITTLDMTMVGLDCILVDISQTAGKLAAHGFQLLVAHEFWFRIET